MVVNAIKHIQVQSFGPFGDIDVQLSPRLNVIVGDNSTGKSQLLKLLYSCTRSLKDSTSLTKKELNTALASK